jgi:hypothetical protein
MSHSPLTIATAVADRHVCTRAVFGGTYIRTWSSSPPRRGGRHSYTTGWLAGWLAGTLNHASVKGRDISRARYSEQVHAAKLGSAGGTCFRSGVSAPRVSSGPLASWTGLGGPSAHGCQHHVCHSAQASWIWLWAPSAQGCQHHVLSGPLASWTWLGGPSAQACQHHMSSGAQEVQAGVMVLAENTGTVNVLYDRRLLEC